MIAAMILRRILCSIAVASTLQAAYAEDLYKPGSWATMSADRKAMQVGDALTVVVYQTAEATHSAKSDSAKSTNLSGGLTAGPINESGALRLGSSHTGGGQVQRSERFVTQISVVVDAVLPNGDLHVSGTQRMLVNGETSMIGVRGRVRTADITSDNQVLSSRVADAQINYNGQGFFSGNSKPGVISRLFRFLGLG